MHAQPNPFGAPTRHDATDTPHFGSASPIPTDYVMVPRCILERLLRHADSAQRRFPTRTVGQIAQTLRHLLGISS